MMANSHTITRRAALVGALTSAAAAFPAMATSRQVTFDPQPLASMYLDGRRVLVDLADLPKQSTVLDEETITEWRPRGTIEHVSQPDVGAEYVVLTHEGDILITRLEANYTVGVADPRRGFMAGTHMGYRAWHQVRVLGKVVVSRGA